MQTQINGTIIEGGVTSRQSRNGQHTMYDVQLSDGNKYTTFNSDLAQKAAGLQGQPITANVKVTQKPGNNGRTFTNYDLEDIGPQGTVVPSAPEQQAQAAQIQPAQVIQPAGQVVIPQQQSSSGYSNEDTARMGRYAAAKIAFSFVGSLYNGGGPEAGQEALGKARALTEAILTYGQNGTWGGVPATPAEVAATVPGVQVGVDQVEAAQAEQPTEAVAAAGADIPWN